MIKKKLTAVRDWMEDGLRSLLGRITPDGRIIVILVMLFVFGAGSIYMTVSSIYNIGKKSAEKEFMETKNKALAVVNAVKEAGRL